MIKIVFVLTGILLSFDVAHAGRIRNRKVKEAPKSCKLMQEDPMLSRDGKTVFGTLRHSLIFEKNEMEDSVSLVKDKGEKICEWSGDKWNQVLKNNGVENIIGFKYHVDEFKEVLYPYVRKADGSYFMVSIPFSSCSLDNQVTREKLELPKCETAKKSKKKKSKKKTA
ncbi:MAG: hypothetical protein ACXVAX_06160 [Pseudobdellovibrio sp.]